MTFATLPTIVHSVAAAVYIIVAVLALRKRGFGDLVSRLLVSYLVLAALWEGVQASHDYLF